jgi:hypothetical protein
MMSKKEMPRYGRRLGSIGSATSAISACLMLALPWLNTLPLRPAIAVWIKSIAIPLLGGALVSASSGDTMVWIRTIPGAILVALSVFLLICFVGKKRAMLGAVAASLGLAACVAGYAFARLGTSTTAATVSLITAVVVLGLGLLFMGLRIEVLHGEGKPDRLLAALRALLIATGVCLASFALFPLGVVLFTVSLALMAIVLARRSVSSAA